ncbi:MAG: ZIP family metal transporter [Clostridia bacterium]
MIYSIKVLLIITIICGISSFIGGALGCFAKKKNSTGAIFQFTAGIMNAIVFFEMIPECFELSNIFLVVLGLVVGVILIYISEKILTKKTDQVGVQALYTLILISMGSHNILEGIAIGSSLFLSINFGYKVLILMILHDILEGIVIGSSNIISTKSLKKSLKSSFLVGAITGIGAFFGSCFSQISTNFLVICLAMASGAMIYMSACNLIPKSFEYIKYKKVYIFYILGIIIGMIITKI